MGDYEDIGRRLRAIREARGFTQEQTADALGASRHTYFRYEAGATKLPLMDVPRLAEIWGMRRLTLLRLMGLAELDDTEPVQPWMLELFSPANQTQQNPAPPFGRTLRKGRNPAASTRLESGGPTYTAAFAARAHRPLSRTPVLRAAAV